MQQRTKMRFSEKLWFSACLILVAGIASAADLAGETSNAIEISIQRANKALVQRLFYAGFSGGDLEIVESIFSPEITLVDPNLPPGIEGIKAIVKKNNETFEGWSFALHDVLAVDDKVVVRWTGSGIHARSFMNETPTNRRVELNGMSIYQIANGRIITDWVIPDNLQFLMQLGILPPLEMVDEAGPVARN